NISDTFDDSLLREAESRLGVLVASWKNEKLYQDGLRVVLCGKTNAGKSSLFNSLLKEDRAIVSDIEGTTRDWLESWVSFDGLPARIFDTAGLRKTDDIIEAAGVERTKDLSKEADLILYLVDSTAGLTDEDKAFMENAGDLPVILVWNKCDSSESKPMPQGGPWKNAVSLSAKTGSGTAILAQAVKKLLEDAESTSRSGAALGSERQKDSVAEALERVSHALNVAGTGLSMDAVVQDLEDSLDSLGEVTGEVSADDILESIFSNFCVGK
ncbi:MAG: 50S ribosome-binding GTPase, partial [Treponema sp.]|nr:50S ribosome-binding GTPase [Treponema sp.]